MKVILAIASWSKVWRHRNSWPYHIMWLQWRQQDWFSRICWHDDAQVIQYISSLACHPFETLWDRNILAGNLQYLVVMKPELEFSGSSRAELWSFRAELGHFNFRAETELTIRQNIAILFSQFFPQVIIIRFCLHIYQFRDHLLANKVFLELNYMNYTI